MKRIHVVAAIIYSDDKHKILIAKRPEHLHKGGYWEFPGGKVEQGEAEEQALARELKEELNISYQSAESFHSLQYDYPEKQISLSFWSVYGVPTDQVKAMEGQECAWVEIAQLSSYQFPEANKPILAMLL